MVYPDLSRVAVRTAAPVAGSGRFRLPLDRPEAATVLSRALRIAVASTSQLVPLTQSKVK